MLSIRLYERRRKLYENETRYAEDIRTFNKPEYIQHEAYQNIGSKEISRI